MTCKKYLHRIEVAQNKAIRAILGARYNDHVTPLYKRLGILKFCDLQATQALLLVYKFVNGLAPSPLLNMFKYYRDVHGHHTRHSTDPMPPRGNSVILRKIYLVVISGYCCQELEIPTHF